MAVKHVFTIDPVFSFADTLAAELLRRHRSVPTDLAKTVLFLPTRRACKTVREAFLRQSNGQPLVLPRMIPFSAVEDEETQGRLSLLNVVDLPDAINPLRRRLLLARLIQKRTPVNAEKALYLADALAQFLDETYIENMPFDRLNNLVPDEFAAHWQETLTFLEIITTAWPEILKQENVIDAADRRVRLFKAQADFWRSNPPSFPVIAAGSTGSQPATAELLDTIAGMENGEVILPGLDRLLDEDSFALCEPSHPQYHLKKLLDKMGLKRSDVRLFGNNTPVRDERPVVSSDDDRLLTAKGPIVHFRRWKAYFSGNLHREVFDERLRIKPRDPRLYDMRRRGSPPTLIPSSTLVAQGDLCLTPAERPAALGASSSRPCESRVLSHLRKTPPHVPFRKCNQVGRGILGGNGVRSA